MTKEGRTAIVESIGNWSTHIILRGGSDQPNYSSTHVERMAQILAKAELTPNIMVDFSYANSFKTPSWQREVCDDIVRQINAGEERIFGVMIESHLIQGNQKVLAGQTLTYGQSITDAVSIGQTRKNFAEI